MACFVDLAKAYDTIPRALLFRALREELGVSPGNVRCLYQMYTDIRASVLLGSSYSAAFAIEEGVR